MRILGIILIVIGLLTLALPYLTFTKKEKVLDIGPIEAVAETKETISNFADHWSGNPRRRSGDCHCAIRKGAA